MRNTPRATDPSAAETASATGSLPLDRNVGGVLASHLVGRGFGFVAFVLIARSLSPTDLGRFAFVTALTEAIRLAIDSGLSPASVRRLASLPRSDWPLTLAVARRARVGAALLGVTLALAVSLLPPLSALRLEIGIASLGIATGLFVAGVSVSLQAAGALHRLPVLHGAGGLIQLVLAAGGAAGHGSVAFFLMIAPAADLIRLAIGQRLICDLGPNTGPTGSTRAAREGDVAEEFRLLWRHSLPLAAAGSLGLLSARVDVWLLGAFGSLGDVGAFSIAAKVCEAFLVIPASVSAAMLPVLAAQWRDERPSFGRTLAVSSRVHGLAGAVMLVLVSFGAAWALPALFPATPRLPTVATVVAVSSLLIFINQPPIDALIAAGRSQRVMGIAATALTGMVVADLFLIPRFGATGAAVAAVIGHGIGRRLLLRTLDDALAGTQPASAIFPLPLASLAVAGTALLRPLLVLPVGVAVLGWSAWTAPRSWRALRAAVAGGASAPSTTVPSA